ncbi:hypothetical protein EBU71_17615, partial [bacterium]|nr:hypothetical protein [Candidatus Elulimicrobium humile]
DPSSTMAGSMTFSVNTNRRRINDNVGFGVTVLRTVQGTFSGGTSSLSGPVSGQNWFIDTYTPTSTTFSEFFDDENYRLKNLSSKYSSYHLVTDVTNSLNAWTSSQSLYTGLGTDNGLQVINGLLVYPTKNFSGYGTSSTNPNYNIGAARDYSNCFSVNTGFGTSSTSSPTNWRSYTRWFYFGATPGVGTPFNFKKATLKISYSGTTFVKSNTSLASSASNAWLEIKLPFGKLGVQGGEQPSGSITGWLDPTQPFISGNYGDGDGCLSGTLPTTSGQDWLLDFGIKGTEFSNGYVLLRITVSPSYTGNITSIQLTGRV